MFPNFQIIQDAGCSKHVVRLGGPAEIPHALHKLSDKDAVDLFDGAASAGGGDSAFAEPHRMALKMKSRMLRSYIASFGQEGQTPPCRSYRNLILVDEFHPIIQRMQLAANAVTCLNSEENP